jgi:hypothetical protein
MLAYNPVVDLNLALIGHLRLNLQMVSIRSEEYDVDLLRQNVMPQA